MILAIVALVAGFGGHFLGLVDRYFDAVDRGLIPAGQTGFTELPGVPRQVATKDGIALVRSHNVRFGDDTAGLTVVEFSDFQCPFCLEMFPVVRSLMNEYRDRVQFVYRHMPIVEIHPLAFFTASVAECAADQKKFWEYHDALFANQDALYRIGSDLERARQTALLFAERLNLDMKPFESCIKNRTNDHRVQQDYQDGVALGVRGTPTFFFNGIKVEGVIPEKDFKNIIEQFLK